MILEISEEQARALEKVLKEDPREAPQDSYRAAEYGRQQNLLRPIYNQLLHRG